MPFACSICEQESTKICAFCTKDACDNHLCQRCGCCSDCCECEVPLEEAAPHHDAPAEADHPPVPTLAAAPEATAPPVAHSPAFDAPSAEPPETSEV